MSIHRRVTALAATTTLAGLSAIGLTAPASAAVSAAPAAVTTVHPDGYEASSVKTRGYCKGWVYTKKSNGHWFAKGVMTSRGGGYIWHCEMHIERKHGSGAYSQISDEHQPTNGEPVWTGYYWDDSGYKVRICVANLDWGDQTFYCGKGV